MSDYFSQLDRVGLIHRYREAGYKTEDARRLADEDLDESYREVLKRESARNLTAEFDNLSSIETNYTDLDDRQEDLENVLDLHLVTHVCNENNVPYTDASIRVVNQRLQHVARSSDIRIPVITTETASKHGLTKREFMLHLEAGLGQSLKEIWQKIRSAFVNTFNKVKTWWIKTFDATKRLGDKAKAIREMADKKTGTIQTTSFDFGSGNKLYISGKFPDPNTLVNKITSMSDVSTSILTKTPEGYNKISDTMVDYLEKMIATIPESDKSKPEASNPKPGEQPVNDTAASQQLEDQEKNKDKGFVQDVTNTEFIKKLIAVCHEIRNSIPKELEEWAVADWSKDKRFESMAVKEGDTPTTHAELLRFNDLPGGMMFVLSAVKKDFQVNSNDSLRDLKSIFGGTVVTIKERPSEPSGSVTAKTLNQQQIISLCDTIMDACKAGLDYRQLFIERDKAFSSLEKELERVVNEGDKHSGKALSFIKDNATAAVSIFGKMNKIEGSWFKYSMGVYSTAIDYCQASLGHIN